MLTAQGSRKSRLLWACAIAVVAGVAASVISVLPGVLWIFRKVAVHEDIAYVKDQSSAHTLDLYLPDQFWGKPLPVVMFIHGGAWIKGDKGVGAPDFLARQGFATASINYRLATQAKFPAQLDDCRSAIKWIKANADRYHLDASHIGVWGVSSGGHLAALVGLLPEVNGKSKPENKDAESDQVQAVCDCCGPTDLETIGQQCHQNGVIDWRSKGSPLDLLLGGPLKEHLGQARQASPVNFVRDSAPPFLIMHGDKDDTVPIAQSQELARALTGVGAKCELVIVKGGDHNFLDRASLAQIKEFFDSSLCSGSSLH